MGNHTNFKGMFNKERIEDLEKRVKELERKEYKVGDIVRLSGKYKYAKVIESNKCNGCVLMGKGCNVICGERERSDGKSIVLLPCNKKGELL